jgi:hypothetical protein
MPHLSIPRPAKKNSVPALGIGLHQRTVVGVDRETPEFSGGWSTRNLKRPRTKGLTKLDLGQSGRLEIIGGRSDSSDHALFASLRKAGLRPQIISDNDLADNKVWRPGHIASPPPYTAELKF